MLQIPASSPLHAAVMLGSLTQRSGDMAGKRDVKRLLFYGFVLKSPLKYNMEMEGLFFFL